VEISVKDQFKVAARGSLEGISNSAVFDPVDVGAKTTVTEQLRDALIDLPEHPSDFFENSLRFAPPRAMAPTVRAAFPLLLTLKAAETVFPVAILPKSFDAGDTEMEGSEAPNRSPAFITPPGPRSAIPMAVPMTEIRVKVVFFIAHLQIFPETDEIPAR
jgi:hypothetical protein